MMALAGAAALFGAIIGSFLTVVAYRVPRGESIVAPRSHCVDCERQIAAYDNVPILSWIVLRGRCRHCGAKIAARYPLIELATALLFAGLVLLRGAHPYLWLGLPFIALMVVVAAIDLEHRIVPHRILIVATAWVVPVALVVQTTRVPEQLIAATAAGGLLFIAVLAYPAGMGMGDVKLAAVMGLYLGRSVAPALMMAFAVGAIVGIAIMIREGAAARKRALPFAPFLALGGLVGQFVGPEIIDWYTDSFF